MRERSAKERKEQTNLGKLPMEILEREHFSSLSSVTESHFLLLLIRHLFLSSFSAFGEISIHCTTLLLELKMLHSCAAIHFFPLPFPLLAAAAAAEAAAAAGGDQSGEGKKRRQK